jgi:GntR family transcriptional regulator
VQQYHKETIIQYHNDTRELVLNALSGRIHLDFHSDEPIFMQIVRQVEAFVREGTFKPGDQLPTVRELAIDLRINFSTVARAYRVLDDQRLISTQRGRGTFIEASGTGQTVPARRTGPGTEIETTLERLTQRFIREAALTGASKELIEQAIQRQLQSWTMDQKTKSDKQTGG